MTFALTPGKLGFKIGEVLVGLSNGTTDVPETISSTQNKLHTLGYMWNPDTLAYEVPQQPLTDTELRAEPVDIHFVEPGTGFHARMTPLGDQRVVEPFRLIGSGFDSALDIRFWTATNSGAASAAGVTNGVATLTSGTANSGYGQIQTVRKARFIFAHPHQFRGAFRLPDTTEANNTREFGPFSTSAAVTPSDGFAFSFDGTGALTVKAYKGGSVSYSETSGNFNGEVTSYTIDDNIHAFEIQYFVMGAWFWIDGVLIHKLTPTTTPFCNTLTTNATAYSKNSGSGTESADLEVWAMNIVRLGRDLTNPATYYHAAGTTAGVVLKVGPGAVHRVVVSQISNNSVATLYDNTAASGTVLWTSGAMTANANPYSIDFGGMNFTTGLTFVVSGANCSAVWVYE
jgi:hypothetical protein